MTNIELEQNERDKMYREVEDGLTVNQALRNSFDPVRKQGLRTTSYKCCEEEEVKGEADAQFENSHDELGDFRIKTTQLEVEKNPVNQVDGPGLDGEAIF